MDLWVWYTYNGGLLYAFSFVVLEVEGRKEGGSRFQDIITEKEMIGRSRDSSSMGIWRYGYSQGRAIMRKQDSTIKITNQRSTVCPYARCNPTIQYAELFGLRNLIYIAFCLRGAY